MLHQVQQAIEPRISLSHVFEAWREIKENLAENIRKRKLQMNNTLLG
jgi:hypothetical protein